MNLSPDFLAHPCVFAVGNEYQIMLGVNQACVLWIEVAGERYCDSAAGVLRSDCVTHSVRIPMERLDASGSYTICYRNIVERRPYFPILAEETRISYAFRPLPNNRPVRLYHISDAHSRVEAPLAAARAFDEELDLLVLNGDVLNHAGSDRDMQTVLLIGGALTKGGIPIACSRGNHDMRGFYAERVTDYIPSHHGNFYYTFRIGTVWGVILDCAEDKPDENPEYGGTICCHAYREEQTRMLRDIVKRKEQEYEAPEVQYRLVIAHNPFGYVIEPPFDIEQDTYATWCRILKEEIKPDLMLTGHHHATRIEMPGSKFDHLGQPCPVVIGSKPLDNGGFVGCGILLDRDRAIVTFNDHNGTVCGKEEIVLERLRGEGK